MTYELEDGEIESNSDTNEPISLLGSSKDGENDESEIDKIIRETATHNKKDEDEKLREALLCQIKMKKENRSAKILATPKKSDEICHRSSSSSRRRSGENRKYQNSSRARISSTSKKQNDEPAFKNAKIMPKTYWIPPTQKLDYTIPPPPPPPLMPQITPITTTKDNYDSIDMDIEEGEKSNNEDDAEALRHLLLSQLRSSPNMKKKENNYKDISINQTASMPSTSQSEAVDKIRSLDRKIRTNTHIIEKSVTELKRLQDQVDKAKSRIFSCRDEVKESIKEKKHWENYIQNLQFQKIEQICAEINFDSYDISKIYKESENLSKLVKLNEEISEINEKDGNDGYSTISESAGEMEEITPEEAGNDDQMTNINSTNYGLINLSSEESEETLRRKLLATLSKRENSAPPECLGNSLEDTIEYQKKGKDLLLKLCKFDMNGICERGNACKYLHLKNGRFDEKLILETILRYIYAYSEQDIEQALKQMLAVRPNHSSFANFVKSFLSTTLSNDYETKNRFNTFFQQGY